MKQLIWALVLMGMVMAVGAGAGEDVRQNMLEARYGQLECRAAFLNEVMDNAEYFNPDANFDTEREELEDEMSALGEYVENGDWESINEEITDTREIFVNALNKARDAHREALDEVNDSAERTALISEMYEKHDVAAEHFRECSATSLRERIVAELESFEGWLEKGHETAERMEENDYDVSGLESILAEGEELADSLRNLDEDTEADDLAELRREIWSREFYLWAEFHVERFNLILDRVDERTEGEYSSEIEGIRETLKSALEIGEDEEYGVSEAAQARRTINTAALELRDLLDKIGVE